MNKLKIRQKIIEMRYRKRLSYKRIISILKTKYEKIPSMKTIKRWVKKYKKGWNLHDKSQRPKTIYYKITKDIKERVAIIREKTGWEAYKIKIILQRENIFISESSIKNIIKEYKLSRGSKMQGTKLKWVRWQRKHPNSLWQIDHSDEQDEEGNWCISVIDDCSRYSLALRKYQSITTEVVIQLLEEIIEMHGKPREILTDNGSAYGGNGEGDNEFDRWCLKKGIRHIRTGVHRPTTTGKVERLFWTIDSEIAYCNNDLERRTTIPL